MAPKPSGTLHEIFVAAGLDKLQVGMTPETGAAANTASVTLAEWLENLTAQLINTDMSAAGLVGLAVIIYAAIGLMVTIENSFNIIYRAPDGRPWSRRFPLYWFILTTSPIVIGITSYVNQLFTNWIDTVEAWHGVLLVARYVWGFSIPCLFIVAVYTLIPNSKVSVKAAFGGAFVATMLLWFGKNTLGRVPRKRFCYQPTVRLARACTALHVLGLHHVVGGVVRARGCSHHTDARPPHD